MRTRWISAVVVSLGLITCSKMMAQNTNGWKLTASDGFAGNSFGSSVAISGDTVVAADVISAYVFTRNGTGWVEQAKLVLPGDVPIDSVAASGNTIAVGSISANAVFVFVRDGTNWLQQAMLVSPDPVEGGAFAFGVAISGDTIVVGDPLGIATDFDTGVDQHTGAAYVFERSGSIWTPGAKLLADQPRNLDNLGISVAISGDVIVGGVGDYDPNLDASFGAVYIFVRNGTTWTRLQKLVAADRLPGSGFGVTVGLSGFSIVVGDPLADAGSAVGAGAVYVYDGDGITWDQQAKLVAGNPAAGDHFGGSVAISGDNIVVGAPETDTNAVSNVGTAYLFVRSGAIWSQQNTLLASAQISDDRFGSSVAGDGITFVAGAPGSVSSTGAAYVFSATGCSLAVQRLSQGDPRWATNKYDHSTTQTIRARGCALTCLTMALNFVNLTNISVNGLTVTNNSGNLNQFMIDQPLDYTNTNGTSRGSCVSWANTTRDVSGGNLIWHGTNINSITSFAAATNYLENTVCNLGFPVPVKVNLNSSPSHYVLVTGKDGDSFTIADPGHSDRTSLTNYNNEFETRGYLSPTNGASALRFTSLAPQSGASADLSAFYLASSDAVTLLVVDPTGKRTGIDPSSGNRIVEIPQSVHFVDEIGDDETDESATESSHQIYIDQPSPGTHQIRATAFKDGPFRLGLRVFSSDGTPQPPVIIDGVATNGATSIFNVPVTLEPAVPHDLAVIKLKAPKKITLSATVANVIGKFSVSIQNRSVHSEVITDMTMLSNLVTLVVQTLGACPDVTPAMLPPKGTFPITLLPKKKLTLAFTAAFDCYNDPLATTKTAAHSDFRIIASVHHDAIDGQPDTHTADDNCPRAALPGGTDSNPDPSKPLKDTGCAGGIDVKTDVFIKQ